VIIAWVMLVVFIVGVVALSVTLAIIILHLLDKGLDTLILCLKHHPLRASNPIEYVRGYSNYKATPSKVSVHSQISLHEVIHSFITRFIKNIFESTLNKCRSACQNSDTQGNDKNYSRYLKCFIPIKHILTIVSSHKLRCQRKWKRTQDNIMFDK